MTDDLLSTSADRVHKTSLARILVLKPSLTIFITLPDIEIGGGSDAIENLVMTFYRAIKTQNDNNK